MSEMNMVNEKDVTKRNEEYNDYVTKVTPKHSTLKNVIYAFFSGGITCTIGQILLEVYKKASLDEKTAASYETLTLIAISVLLTGFGAFAKLAKHAGAGVIVPITGFANSVDSAAIEFKKEGQVYGIGCKIFTIAGPVILYGMVTSWLLGLVYWIVLLLQKI